MNVILRTEQVTKRVPSGQTILDNVSLQLTEGEIVAVVGPSGAGKSTLLSLAGLLDRPSTGEVHLSGRRVDHLRRRAISTIRREEVGFLFQNVHLLLGLSAFDNALMGLTYSTLGAEEREAKVLAALEDVGLKDVAWRRSADLSGGERQRVALARAMVRDPAVLLCDEPTGSLDPANGLRVTGLLRKQASLGTAVMLVTHSAEVAGIAARVIEIRDGRLV